MKMGRQHRSCQKKQIAKLEACPNQWSSAYHNTFLLLLGLTRRSARAVPFPTTHLAYQSTRNYVFGTSVWLTLSHRPFDHRASNQANREVASAKAPNVLG